MNKFVHLHGHSEYSLLDGYSRFPSIVKRLKEIEQTAVALTDHGSLSGAHKFVEICNKENIKPIVGYEGYFCRDRRLKNKDNKKTYHIILIAQNKVGYKNLIRLASDAATQGFYYKPRVDLDLLEKHSKGLICTTACIASQFNQLLLDGNEKRAKDHLMDLQNIFEDRLYIEIQNHEIPEQQLLLSSAVNLSRRLGVPLVATNDYHYVYPEDAHYQDIIFCDQLKANLDDPTRLKLNEHFYIKTREEMREMLPHEEALDNTLKIAESCDVYFGRAVSVLPSFENEEQRFDDLINDGIVDRFELLPDDTYKQRLKDEVRIIKDAKLIGYFLTVTDYIQWAKANDVMVGPGRGSVAGSLLAYILHIHDVDPIKYDLLFSRFYNAGRKKSLPDVDTDFAESDVDKVIDYLVETYGNECVAHIGTFQRIAGRGAIKLVCRVNKIPFELANEYSALVDAKKHKTIADAMESASFSMKYESDDAFKRIVDEAQKVENITVSQGVHAAGIVISNKPIIETVPIRKDKNTDLQVTAWDMEDVESAGLVKFDFLSLGTLDVMRNCMELAGLDQNYLDFPLDDDKAYELISTTGNVGVFQLSSSGISLLANSMVVKSIDDIAVVVALYRPGPLESGLDKLYLDRRFGNKAVEYLHSKCESALKPTLGVLVFQEQITRLVMDLASFDEEEADELRKVIGKKLIEKAGGKTKLKRIGSNFIKRCTENGIDKGIADIIWGQINKFAGYAFNKAHATSYALLTYYTAYLKAHHPVEYVTALLNSAIGKPDKMKNYLTECKRMKIELITPRHHHQEKFTCEDGKILFGLNGIKGLGGSAYKKIQGRKFTEYVDFVIKVKPEKDTLIALIEAGALDGMGYSRRAMMSVAEDLVLEARQYTRKRNPDQKSLFKTTFRYDVPKMPEFTDKELSAMELDKLGAYIGFNPLDKYKDFIEKYTLTPDGNNIPYNENVRIVCIPIRMKTFLTKASQREMCICNTETAGDPVELVVFPRAYARMKYLIKVGSPIIVSGKVIMGEKFSITAENVEGI